MWIPTEQRGAEPMGGGDFRRRGGDPIGGCGPTSRRDLMVAVHIVPKLLPRHEPPVVPSSVSLEISAKACQQTARNPQRRVQSSCSVDLTAIIPFGYHRPNAVDFGDVGRLWRNFEWQTFAEHV